MEVDVLKSDSISKSIMYLITVVSIFVSGIEIVTSLDVFTTFKINGMSMQQIIYTTLQNIDLIMLITSIFQFVVSIYCLKSTVRSGNYENAGQTALLCYSIVLNFVAAIFTPVISNAIGRGFSILFLEPFMLPLSLFMIMLFLSTFVKTFVIRKKYKSLKLLQIVMNTIGVLFFVLNMQTMLEIAGTDIWGKVNLFSNIAILGLIILEGLSTIVFLSVNACLINDQLYSDLESELVKIKGNIEIRKVYFQKTEKQKIHIFGDVCFYIFLAAFSVYIIYEMVVGWAGVDKVFNIVKQGVSGDMVRFNAITISNLIKPIFLIYIAFSLIKAALGVIFVRKAEYLNVANFLINFGIYLLLDTFSSTSLLKSLGLTENLGKTVTIILMVALSFGSIIINAIKKSVQESIKTGDRGEKVMKKIMFLVLAGIAIVGEICFLNYSSNYEAIYLVILGFTTLALPLFIIEIQKPKSEYFIYKRKVRANENNPENLKQELEELNNQLDSLEEDLNKEFNELDKELENLKKLAEEDAN